MIDAGLPHPARGAAAEAGAAPGRAAKVRSDRHLFRRLGAAHGPRPRRGRLWRPGGADDAREPAAEAGARRPSAAPASAGRRSRWWRCGPTAGSSRWSAAATMRGARSTAPPRRGASRARRSSCSSISPRSAPGMTPDTSDRRHAASDRQLAAEELRRPLSRHASPCATRSLCRATSPRCGCRSGSGGRT